ncbi:MAG: PqiC family protein [Desulfobacterales bacterium]
MRRSVAPVELLSAQRLAGSRDRPNNNRSFRWLVDRHWAGFLSEFERWAEPLKNNFMRVFKEDLVDRLGTDNIFIYPWSPDADVEFQVSAEVTRFDAHPGDSTKLDVQWTILRAQDREVILSRKSSYAVDLDRSDYKTIVAAQSRTVADFSREVAAAVTEVYRREHGH